MAIIRLKGNSTHGKNIYYEFDTSSEPLGEGGMGKVYRGKQISELTGISKDVAIKFMFDGLPQTVIDRARREAKIQVDSENLVEMIDFIETTSHGPNNSTVSHYHVVSELLTGVMLADLMKGMTTTKDGIEVPFAQRLLKMYEEDRASFALTVMKNIASGIMVLHDKGYIHRDIDPTNIMVTTDGKIKLIDFGIAKKLPNRNTTGSEHLSTQDRSLTMTGQFMGKPQYAAPELVVGDIDYQNETTDIYAMGILFYQLLVGKLPFTGPVTKVLEAQKKQKTPIKNVVGMDDVADFRAIIAKATEKDQDKRYQSAAEFRVALDSVGTGFGKTSWMKYMLTTLAVLIVVGAGVFAFISGFGGEKTLRDQLMDPSTAKEAWEKLQTQKDAESLFLQSRIYAKIPATREISEYKKNLESILKSDNIKAHKLLEEAHIKAPDDCNILFHLGEDYFEGESYGAPQRDYVKAKKYFKHAKESAIKSNKTFRLEEIESYLEELSDIDESQDTKDEMLEP